MEQTTSITAKQVLTLYSVYCSLDSVLIEPEWIKRIQKEHPNFKPENSVAPYKIMVSEDRNWRMTNIFNEFFLSNKLIEELIAFSLKEVKASTNPDVKAFDFDFINALTVKQIKRYLEDYQAYL